MSLFCARRSRAEFGVVVTLGGDGLLTLGDDGRLTLGDAGIAVVAVLGGQPMFCYGVKLISTFSRKYRIIELKLWRCHFCLRKGATQKGILKRLQVSLQPREFHLACPFAEMLRYGGKNELFWRYALI